MKIGDKGTAVVQYQSGPKRVDAEVLAFDGPLVQVKTRGHGTIWIGKSHVTINKRRSK